MAHDYTDRHPDQHVPDLSKDTVLTKEAHALLDNPDNWRQQFRDPSKFADALLVAAKAGLDKNNNGIIGPNEMYDFVNDSKQPTSAREAVEILREHPTLFSKAANTDWIRYEVEMGMNTGAEDHHYKDEVTGSITDRMMKHLSLAGLVGVSVGAATAMATKNEDLTLVAAAIAGGATLVTTLSGDVFDLIVVGGEASKAHEYRKMLEPLDLFDPKLSGLMDINEYRKSHGAF